MQRAAKSLAATHLVRDLEEAAAAERLTAAAIRPSDQGLFGGSEGEKVAAELVDEKNQHDGRPAWHEFWRAHQLTTDRYRMLFIEPDEDADDGDDDEG